LLRDEQQWIEGAIQSAGRFASGWSDISVRHEDCLAEAFEIVP
jgi:hypothetical protein